MEVKAGSAEIISVGNELLNGRTVNTNAAFLSRELGKLGFEVGRVQTVADDEAEIIGALRNAVARAKVIILSGGLGPTDDDLTKETVAKVLGMPLQLDEEVLEDIRAFFESRGREMAENNVKQAMVPRGATVLRNANGTAPGIFIGNRSQAIALLPGPPHELEALFRDKLAPILEGMEDGFIRTANLGVAGIGESDLEEKVKDLLYGENPHSALYAEEGQVQICVTARGETAEEAESLLREKTDAFAEAVGEDLFTTEGARISEAVVKQLLERKQSVGVAESCTGGMVAEQITAIPGSSAAFQYGIASYSDWVKSSGLDVDRDLINKYTSVSSVVAAEMARGAKRNGRADYGVGITGLAGPGNGGYYDKPVGLVYISVCDRNRTLVKKFTFGDKRNRESIRRMAAVNAFDMLRRLMNGYAIPGAFEFGNRDIADIDRQDAPRKKGGLVLRKSLSLLLIAGILITACRWGIVKAAAAVRRKGYSRLAESYSSLVEEKGMEGVAEVNADHPNVIGWLKNGNGDLDSPVALGRTDDYFTVKDFDGKNNRLGACTVLAGTDMNAAPRNLVIESVCTEEGIMLGSLSRYLDPEYAKQHCWFLFRGLDFVQYYRLVGVLYLDGEEDADGAFRRHYFRNAEAAQHFVVNAEMRSVCFTGEPVYSDDSFLTLISPVKDGYEGQKLVVVARAVGTKGQAEASMDLKAKETCVMPQKWYEANGVEISANVTAESDYWRQLLLPTATEKNGSASIIDDPEKYIKVSVDGQDVTLTPLDAVSRMVASDVGETEYQDDTLKAAAIAAISRLKYALSSGETAEVPAAEPSERIIENVSQVINMTLQYYGENCWAPVFPCSAGATVSFEELYGGEIPYLVSVPSEYDHTLAENGYRFEKIMTADELRSVLEESLGITLSEGDPSGWIRITRTLPGGYVAEAEVDGAIAMTGTELFMEVLGLPSWSVTLDWGAGGVSLTSLGTGDGVGMSLGGADKYIIGQSWKYQDVLLHYYQGAQLVSEDWNDYYCN